MKNPKIQKVRLPMKVVTKMSKREFLSKEFQTACAIYHIHDKELGDATLQNIIKVSELRPTIVSEAIKFLQNWSIISLEPIKEDGEFVYKFKYYIRGMSESNIRELYERYWLQSSEETGDKPQ